MRADRIASLKSDLLSDIHNPPDNTVTANHLAELDAARDYDAASSYNYLFAELMVIKHAVSRGRSIVIESSPPETISNAEAFMTWALARYPAFREPGYHDLYLDPVALVWDDES